MTKLFEERRAKAAGNVRSAAELSEFLKNEFDRDAFASAPHIPSAERLLDKPVPTLPASLYMEFYRNGNRSNFEDKYFERRGNLMTLLRAELAEKQGRFTDKIVDYVWAICEESTWILPAHNKIHTDGAIPCLPDSFGMIDGERVREIDLFSAGTGAMMSWIWYFADELLDGITPAIRRRIRNLIKNRIIHPFNNVDGQENWWMGVDVTRKLNNWTPWIVSNVLTSALICGDDDEIPNVLDRSMLFLDNFTAGYADDAGCDEGPSYWGEAGASYFDCLELISDMTGGRISLFDEPFVKRMCEYIVDVNLGGNVFANFGDASHILGVDSHLIARMGRKCSSDKLNAFASGFFRDGQPSFSYNTSYRGVRNLGESVPKVVVCTESADGAIYPGIGLMIAKNAANGFALAVKGGCNNVSHNHNDIGSFMLFRDARPIIIDGGVEQYTRTTFSDARYTIWTMRSSYHNVPVICGVEQKSGSWHADIVEYDGNSIVYDMKNAYPDEAGIASYTRSASLTDDGLVIEDKIVLDEEGSAEFVLMLAENPVMNGNSAVIESAGAEIVFENDLICESDAVALESKLRKEWGRDELVRLKLRSPVFTERTFRLTVKPR